MPFDGPALTGPPLLELADDLVVRVRMPAHQLDVLADVLAGDLDERDEAFVDRLLFVAPIDELAAVGEVWTAHGVAPSLRVLGSPPIGDPGAHAWRGRDVEITTRSGRRRGGRSSSARSWRIRSASSSIVSTAPEPGALVRPCPSKAGLRAGARSTSRWNFWMFTSEPLRCLRVRTSRLPYAAVRLPLRRNSLSKANDDLSRFGKLSAYRPGVSTTEAAFERPAVDTRRPAPQGPRSTAASR